MNDPHLLWPWPWWTALLVVVAAPTVAWSSATYTVWRANRSMQKLTASFRESAMSASERAFSVVGRDHGVVVSGNRLAVLDTRNMRVLKAMSLDDLAILKIYEDGTDRMQFRIVSGRGGQTRKLTAQSIIEMAKFFDLIAQRGIPIEYVQE